MTRPLNCVLLGVMLSAGDSLAEPAPAKMPIPEPERTKQASLTGQQLPAADRIWSTSIERAKKAAAAQNKDLLLDFTGSDWCHWCIKLNKEVFDTAAFKEAAPRKFVLVELDFPHNRELSPEVGQQNLKLQKQFAVRGYPTVVLADATGKPYARTGYQPGGPEAYLQHLQQLQVNKAKFDEGFKKAQNAEGVERAKILAEAIKAVDPDSAEHFYGSVLEEIKALDPAIKIFEPTGPSGTACKTAGSGTPPDASGTSTAGIGVMLANVNGKVTIMECLPGSGAKEAGLKEGDVITHVLADISDLEGTQIARLVRGKPDTEVTLTVIRNGEDKPQTVKVRRHPL